MSMWQLQVWITIMRVKDVTCPPLDHNVHRQFEKKATILVGGDYKLIQTVKFFFRRGKMISGIKPLRQPNIYFISNFLLPTTGESKTCGCEGGSGGYNNLSTYWGIDCLNIWLAMQRTPLNQPMLTGSKFEVLRKRSKFTFLSRFWVSSTVFSNKWSKKMTTY